MWSHISSINLAGVGCDSISASDIVGNLECHVFACGQGAWGAALCSCTLNKNLWIVIF